MYATENKAIKIMNLDPPSRDRLCDELIEKLSSLGDPQTGARIVRRAYRREELYQGPYVEQAPDIILDLHDGYNITNAFFADDYVTPRDQVRGCHHREGIFVACGDEIESGKMLPSYPSLLDVMPTVLHYLGCPVPDDCDGRVLREIFEPDSIPHGQRAVHEPVESIEPVQEGSAVYTDDEQAEIERRLRALGYL
jgi:predicted AlkP superfamily phosphohydrolase/phosphomutase